MEAITLWERTTDGTETGAAFTFSVDAWNELNARYEVSAFIQLLDSDDPDYQLNGNRSAYTITSTTSGNVTLSLDFSGSSYSNKALQAGFKMEGINANPDTDWGSVTVTAHDVVASIPDSTAPTPNPMVFFVDPAPVSDNTISMTASNAVDNAYGLEYYFQCTSGLNDSGWQESATYTILDYNWTSICIPRHRERYESQSKCYGSFCSGFYQHSRNGYNRTFTRSNAVFLK